MATIPYQLKTSLPSGVIGTFAFATPKHVATAVISSETEKNIPGRYCSYKADGSVEIGGTGAFAGILINSKYNSLVMQLDTNMIQQGASVEFCFDQGEIFVELSNTANIGDIVVANTTDGTLSAKATAGAGDVVVGRVVRHASTQDTPSLSIIQVQQKGIQ